jgi:hypothetical protein
MEPKSMMRLAGSAAVDAARDLRNQLRCPNKELFTILVIGGAILSWYLAQYCADYNIWTGAEFDLSPREAQDM